MTDVVEAAAYCQREWMARSALAADGRTAGAAGITWLLHPPPAARLAVPPADLAGVELPAAADAVTRAAHGYGVTEAGWWLAEPDQPVELDGALLARGFERGWRPLWMARTAAGRGWPVPPGTTVRPESSGDVLDLHARQDGRPVGQVSLLLPAGPTAGLFDLEVHPGFRRRGLGGALAAAACDLAAEHGYVRVVLNATPMGEPVYRRLGFRPAGEGRTWWLAQHALSAGPPDPARVAVAESICRGDLEALSVRAAVGELPPDLVLPNGLTPTALAALTGQEPAARWLAARGFALHPLDAWDLGWRTVAAGLLAADPAISVRDRPGATVLHAAVERDDPDLAAVALAAGVDPATCDTTYHATARGWSHHLSRHRLAALLADLSR